MTRIRQKEQKIRFTDDEYHYVFKKMKDAKINKFQHFALMMLIQGEVNFTDYTELKQLVYEVKKIGININQVTKLAHQFGEVSPRDIEKLTQSVDFLIQLTTEELAGKIDL